MKIKYLVLLLSLAMSVSLMGDAYATDNRLRGEYFEAKLTYDNSSPPTATTISCERIRYISYSYNLNLELATDPPITKGYNWDEDGVSYNIPTNYESSTIKGSCNAIHKDPNEQDHNHSESFDFPVSITVTSVNRSPTAVNDSVRTKENTLVDIPVLKNDSDPDNDTISIKSFTHSTYGSVKQRGSILTYTPATYFIGEDTFEYTITDDEFFHTATVSVKVIQVSNTQPDPPTDNNEVSIVNHNTNVKKKGNGGCSDCTPPTLGLDKNYKRVVDNGFSYNGQTVQVKNWYTDFPLINATVGIPNIVEIKVYENHGINNMKWVQFCIGAEERGQSLDSCEVLIEAHLLTDGTTTGIMVDDIVIKDNDNLIDNDSVSAVSYVVPCMDDSLSSNCVKVDLQYTYREETINHMMIVNVADKARNAQNFHLNEGVNVLGESLNEPLTITLYNKQTSQQKDDLWITYTRTDKRTDTWFDESGIKYHRINDVTFDRITPQEPYQCNDPPLDQIKVWKRTNCHFRALTDLWSYN